MVYDRSSQAEYDTWEKLGSPGWNWKNMYAAMLRAENFTVVDGKTVQGVGKGGPIQILVNPIRPLYQAFFIPALNKLGIPEIFKSLAGIVVGVAYQPTNIRPSDYKRSYSAHNPGYTSIAGKSLIVLTNTRAAKINFKPSTSSTAKLVASGVTLDNGSVITATKEVILSAGTFQSPGLLELSGIGAKDVLSSAGIKSLINLPGVGENLQDHIRTQVSFQVKDNYTSYDILKYNATYAAEQLALYNQGKRSLYDYSGSTYAFINWKQTVGDDSNLIALAKKAAAEPLTRSQFEPIRAKVLLDYLKKQVDQVPQVEILLSDGYTGVKGYPVKGDPSYGKGFFTLITAFQHPFSLGSVHVTSPSIATPPQINPNYLGHEYDVQAMIAAAKYIRKLANTEPLKNAWIVEHEPGLDVVGNGPDADEQWRKFIANNTLTIYHPAGSCAMLPKEKGGVVDANLTVYGTQNVRVVDASIMPSLKSAQIKSPVYGISERAASIIIGKPIV